AAVPSGGVTVTAQSAAQTSATASAPVTINPAPPSISVSISPISATLQVGQSQQFSATASGTTNNSLTWLVIAPARGNPTVGTISPAATFSRPAAVPSGGVTVTAQSAAQTSATASALVTINPAPPSISVSISPTSATLQVGQSQQFSA